MDSDTSAMLAKYRDRLNEYRHFVEEQEERIASVETSMERQPDCRSPRSFDKGSEDTARQGVGRGGLEESHASTLLNASATTGSGRSPAARRPHSASTTPPAVSPIVIPTQRNANADGRKVGASSQANQAPNGHPTQRPQQPLSARAAAPGARLNGQRKATETAASTPKRQGPSFYDQPQQQQQPSSSRIGVSPRRVNTPGRQSTVSHLQQSRSARVEESAYIEQLFEQQGKYYSTAPPDAMYVKTQLWQRRSQRNAEAVRRELEAEKLAECTFAPQIELSPVRRHHSGQGQSGANSRTTSPGRIDEAVAQHLARLQAARRLKKEKEERLARSPAGRRRNLNELTVPHAPNLGAPVAEPIPSLRKPFVPQVRGHSRSGRSPSRSTPNGTTTAPSSMPRRWVGDGAGKTPLTPPSHTDPASLSVPVPAAASEADRLRQQLSEKDAIIRGQRERIVSLEQELTDVKAMVAELQSRMSNVERGNALAADDANPSPSGAAAEANAGAEPPAEVVKEEDAFEHEL